MCVAYKTVDLKPVKGARYKLRKSHTGDKDPSVDLRQNLSPQSTPIKDPSVDLRQNITSSQSPLELDPVKFSQDISPNFPCELDPVDLIQNLFLISLRSNLILSMLCRIYPLPIHHLWNNFQRYHRLHYLIHLIN